MPKKRLLLFLSLVIVSFILMTYQSKRGAFNPLKHISQPINAVNSYMNSASSYLKDSLKKIRLSDEENKKLRQEIDRLLMEQQKYKEIFLENSRLRALLSLKEKQKRYVTAARVIARGYDRWADTVIIDKGKSSGVEKDMAVITPRGFVGKILSASDSYSSILLVTDINFSAAIRLQESRVEGIISGTGSRPCVLKYIPHEYEIKEREAVFTSGLDSLFPADIPIGAVTKITRKNAGLFQNIEVTPFEDTSRLEEVAIVRR